MLLEEQRLWSKICDDLETILDQADTHGLVREVRDLLDRTRRENVSVWEWKELLDELAEQVWLAMNYAGLGDDPDEPRGVVWRTPVARQVDTGFRCPGGLCDRRLTGGLLGPTPVCQVLAKNMALQA